MFLAIIFILGLWFFSRVSGVYIPHKLHWECCCSVAKSCLTICTPWTTVPQVSLSLSWSLLKLMSIESLMSSNHLILCHPLLLSSILPSSMVFPNELTLCIKWPKFQSFSISPSNEYSGLISFRVDWFYLLAVKGLSRVFSSTAIRKHQFFGTQVFFMLQPSHPYMTTGKTYWCSVQFSCSVVSDSLRPHGLQHARLPCSSPTPRCFSDSCPLSWWCHPTISFFVIPFSSFFNLSQHQGLFQWVSSLHQEAKVLKFQLQRQSFQWIFRTDLL